MRATHLVAVMLTVTACGDDGEPNEVERSRDGGMDARVIDGATDELDARVDVVDATGDAARDAALASEDARTSDASSDASAPPVALTLRERVCGDRTDWPDPLPAQGMRTATQVGSMRFGFIEGPVWIDSLGVLLFSDMDFGGDDANGPPSQIRRLTPPSAFDVFEADSGSNGLALFGTQVIAATHDRRSLSFFHPQSGARTNVDVTFEGNRFNSTNDIAVRDDGWVYFSDPDYQLGDREREIDETSVYRVKLTDPPPTSASAELVDDTLMRPNGVALSPDQKTLYVGSAGSQIYKYTVADDGSVSGRTVFATPGPSDGLGVDCAGNLYVTSGTLEVFAPNGNKLGDIAVPQGPSNVAFGGRDRRTLYITAQDRLYSIELNVPGFPY